MNKLMYEVCCGSKETMESISKKGLKALNPKTMRWQVINKNAEYEIREDKTIFDDENKPHICATLLSNMDLITIAKEKELII